MRISLKNVIPTILILLILSSCASFETESYDSFSFVDVVATDNNNTESILEYPGLIDTYINGFDVSTTYMFCIGGYISFNINIFNATDSIITIYSSDIEAFCGSYQSDEWKSIGRWDPNRSIPEIANHMNMLGYIHNYDPSPDINLVDGLAFRASRVYPGDSYSGNVFIPFYEGEDYYFEITLPDGYVVKHKFDIEPKQED